MTHYIEPPTNFQERAALIEQHILPVAVITGGVAFGGYVRDYKIRSANFKDVDMWFQSEEGATRFIRALVNDTAFTVKPDYVAIYKVTGKEGTPKDLLKDFEWKEPQFVNVTGKTYPFQRMLLFVTRYGLMQYVDVVVSKEFPVNDFTCNCVTWDGANIEAYTRHISYVDEVEGPDVSMVPCDGKQITQAVDDIKAGKVVMLDGYMEAAFSPLFAAQRVAKLLAKGFTDMTAPCLDQAKRLEEKRVKDLKTPETAHGVNITWIKARLEVLSAKPIVTGGDLTPADLQRAYTDRGELAKELETAYLIILRLLRTMPPSSSSSSSSSPSPSPSSSSSVSASPQLPVPSE